MFGINKEPGRATFTPFPDESSATGKDQPSKFVESLNGKWKFNWVKSPIFAPLTFMSPSSMSVRGRRSLFRQTGKCKGTARRFTPTSLFHLSATPLA